MRGALGPVSAERLRARGSQPCCLQLRVSELLAQPPKGRDIYGLITGLLILILFAASGAYPRSEGERAVFVNKSPVGPITQPARLASDQGDELG